MTLASLHVPVSAPPITTEVVTESAALEELTEAWTRLHAASPAATPFQSPGWLVPWTRAFVRGPVEVVLVREGAELVGILPLYRDDVAHERRLRLLGAGCSHYLDGIFRGSEAEASRHVRAAFRTLVERGDWDVCQLEQLREEAVLRAVPLLGASTSRVRLGVETLVGTPGAIACPHLSASSGLPEKQALRLRKARRRADRGGLLVLDVTTHEEDAEAALATFEALRAKSEGTKQATVVDPALRAFLATAVAELARAGLLRIYVLRHGEAPIASLVALGGRSSLHVLGRAVDPAAADLEPELLLVGAVMEDARATGRDCVDVGRERPSVAAEWGAVPNVTVERRVRIVT